MMENYLSTDTADGPMSIYLASEESSKPLPVIIVLQEAFGVNSHIKGICQRLAIEGYLAVAPELFHRADKHITVGYTEREKFFPLMQNLTNEGVMTDVAATLNFLKNISHADLTRVFTLGFCMGGFVSTLAAIRFPLKGAISFYGAGVVENRKGIGLEPYIEKLSETKCPLLLFYGEEDASIPESDRFLIRKELDLAHVPHEMIVYGESDHGFFCNERKTYNARSATAAWSKTLTWLKTLS